MKANISSNDLKIQWEQRRDWQSQAEQTMPDDATLMRMADIAIQTQADNETRMVLFPTRRRNRWIPYAAAASLVIGMVTLGLTRHSETMSRLPETKEMIVNGQTIRFVCNNECSAQDVLLSANKVIKN